MATGYPHAPPGLVWRYVAHQELHHANIYVQSSPQVLRVLFPPLPR